MKRRKIVHLFEDESHELDELVINEILALEKQTLERMKLRRGKIAGTDPADETPTQDIPEPEATKKKKTQQETYAEDEISPVFEVDVSSENDELFDRNEEKFINASVSYLQAKNNKDAIISSIWNRLTESQPDGFFSPEEEADEPPAESDPSQDQAEPDNGITQ